VKSTSEWSLTSDWSTAAVDKSVEVTELPGSTSVVGGCAHLAGRAVAIVYPAIWRTHCIAINVHHTVGGAPHGITGTWFLTHTHPQNQLLICSDKYFLWLILVSEVLE